MTPLDWVLIILAAWILGIPVVVCVIAAIRGACRKLRARRRAGGVPGLPRDGEPLSLAEMERLRLIDRGYQKTASEPGRRM